MKRSLNTLWAARSGRAQSSPAMAHRAVARRAGALAAAFAVAVLAACGGGGDGASQVNDFTGSSGSGSNSSSACNASYTDQVASKTRSNASKDPQCSSYVAYADSYLSTARASCVAGNRSAADQYYENHVKAADYADSTVALLCGSSGSGGIDTGGGNSSSGTQTLYIKYGNSGSNNGRVLAGQCGGSRPSDDAGYQWVAVATNLTSTQCAAKAKEYGLTMN